MIVSPQAAASHDAQSALALAESCASAVSKAMLVGDPPAIEAASRDLRQASLALAEVLQNPRGKGASVPDFKQRLGQVLTNLAMQREALLRRSAVVERSLHSIVPATRASTYAGSARSYGHNAKQSGAFKLLAA